MGSLGATYDAHLRLIEKRIMDFLLVLIERFCLFLPNSIALLANYITLVEDRPIVSETYSLPVPVFHFWPKLTTLHRGLSAIAELLVSVYGDAHAVNQKYSYCFYLLSSSVLN